MKANFFGAVILCVFVCSADQMTSVAQETTKATSEPTQPTTEPSASNVTTVGPSNVTTVGPSNVTTEGPTTAPTSMAPTTSPVPSFPPISTYEVMENSTACLIMEGSFQLKVTYTTRDNTTTNTVVNVPVSSNVTVTGTCASGNDNSSSLTITPKDGEIKSLTFNFEIMNGKSNIISWFADVKIPDAMESEINETVIQNVDLLSPKLYYKCKKEGNFSGNTLAFMYNYLQVQAFNVENGNFSKYGYDCAADAPDEPAPGKPPVETYFASDGKKNCVVFKGGIQFHIPYNSTMGNTVAVILVPTNANFSGECDTTLNGLYTQELTISFYETWELKMYFSSNKKQNKTDLLTADEGVGNYDISQIELTFDYNNNLFMNVDDSIVGRTETVTTNQTFLSTSSSKSYMCNKDTTFALENGLSMVTTNLQFQAFRTTNTTDFDAATECAGDEETNSIVPIAVGAALAGLVIIVLIAYLIGRKRSRSGYEQV